MSKKLLLLSLMLIYSLPTAHAGRDQQLQLIGLVVPQAYLDVEFYSLRTDQHQKVNYLTNSPDEFKIELTGSNGRPIPFYSNNLYFHFMNNDFKEHETVFVTISKI